MKRHLLHDTLLLALVAAAPALAQSSGKDGPVLSVGLGTEHTDNAYKTAVNERSETKEYVDVDLGYRRSGEVLLADVLYNGEFANYEHDTTDENSVIQGRSMLSWRALPDRLQFDLSHERSEQIQDSRNPDIRNNKQLRDIVSAGPVFTARLSPVDRLVFSGRYTDVSYDDSDRNTNQGAQGSDSERAQGGVAWRHNLSKTDLLSVDYQYMESQFDDSPEEFQYQRLFATYAVELRASGYSIALGGNRSERDSGDSSDGFLAQAQWHLETGGHRFRAVAVNELTDSGIGLGGNTLMGGEIRPDDSNYDVVDVVERTRLDLGYGYDRLCERCVVDVGVFVDEQDFDVQPRDQEQAGLRASFLYRLSSTLRAGLRGSYSEIDYPQDALGDRTDERTQYGATLDWQFARSFSARFWLTKDERDSDAAGQGYDELFGGVSVRYSLR